MKAYIGKPLSNGKLGYQAAFHGDLLIRRVDDMPSTDSLEVCEVKDGTYNLVDSSSGHPHRVSAQHATLYRDPNNRAVMYLTSAHPHVDVVHERQAHPHETIRLESHAGAGQSIWLVHRQRESTPEGLREIED